jgi:uncharacterized protein YprB with RNaseH-like and TPR domain
MASLSDRLKALGVQLGVGDLAAKPPVAPKAAFGIEQVVPGRVQLTDFGEAYVVEHFIPADEPHDQHLLRFPAAMQRMAAWAGDTRLALIPAERFLFLDTEATGLWGSGTMAFLIGMGRFEAGGFRCVQLFLREPAEERAMQAVLDHAITPDDALVTFNGKSFDLPLLANRYLANGQRSPLRQLPHIDLLHIARRLWKDLLPSRALGDLEAQLLGITRTGEDLPGWLLPQLFMDYMHTGDARPLAGAFYHNRMDVVSMASLLEHIARKLEAPMELVQHGSEMAAIGRLLADTGFAEEAIEVFQGTLAMELPDDKRGQLLERLASLFRRRGNYEAALQLWQQAADDGQVYAHVEIAKYYEHKTREYTLALEYTVTALKVVRRKRPTNFERVHWEPQLEQRAARLEKKLGR